jgi:hypothetical protein
MPGKHIRHTSNTSPAIRAQRERIRRAKPVTVTSADGTTVTKPAASFTKQGKWVHPKKRMAKRARSLNKSEALH